MKLCKSNIFVNKIFLSDPERTLKSFSYTVSHGLQILAISNKPEVRVIPAVNNRFTINTFRFDSEKQFNQLVIEALLKSCIINNNVTNSLNKVKEFFLTEKTPIAYCLMSNKKPFKKPKINLGSKIFDIFDKINTSHLRILGADGLKENQIIFTPDPSYLGIVAISGDDLDRYAVGITNSAGPLLVELNSEEY